MEFILSNKKRIIIITLIIIVLLTIIFLLSRPSNQSILPFNQQPTPEITGSFTGYVEPEYTTQEQAEIDQNSELYKLSPYIGDGYTITYDYNTFSYLVSTNSEEASTRFNSFIETNYPAIPKEKFIINGLNTQEEKALAEFIVTLLPIESSTFAATAESEPNIPSGYYFLIRIKDQSRGQNDFNAWLQGLNLTQEQIDSLDVRYQ